MQFFTIRDIENLSGIKAHTLRIWEQRYTLFVPKRKQSQHRIYDNEDLKQLLKIAYLYHNGWKISKIASLSQAQIAEEIQNAEPNTTDYKGSILKLIEAAMDFDEIKFLNIIDGITKKIGFDNCITQVCYPYLQRIGLLWMTNNVIPAQEHFSSYIIQNRVIAETEKLSLPEKEPNLILFAPRGEYHELPLLFINYLLRKNGWGVIYLGANITKEVLKQFTGNTKIKYLFLHLITNFTGWDADGYFEDLQKNFPDKTIIATGTAIHQLQRNFVNVTLLKNDKAIYEFIRNKSMLKL
jgi:DNA-binding transcriptional MerR regulator